jgi:hypothetical protein
MQVDWVRPVGVIASVSFIGAFRYPGQDKSWCRNLHNLYPSVLD